MDENTEKAEIRTEEENRPLEVINLVPKDQKVSEGSSEYSISPRQLDSSNQLSEIPFKAESPITVAYTSSQPDSLSSKLQKYKLRLQERDEEIERLTQLLALKETEIERIKTDSEAPSKPSVISG